MYSNFNIKELNDIKEQSINTFSALLNIWKKIKNECNNIIDVIKPYDALLSEEWLSARGSIEDFYDEVDSSFSSYIAKLDLYIEQTMLNEEQALKELNEFDKELDNLSSKTETMLNDLGVLKGNKTEQIIDNSFVGTTESVTKMLDGNATIDVLDEYGTSVKD